MTFGSGHTQMDHEPELRTISLLEESPFDTGHLLSHPYSDEVLWSKKTTTSNLLRYAHGWKFGLYTGLFASIFALASNVALMLVGLLSYGGSVKGIGTLATGDGGYIHNLSTGYHVVINILSTILLVSSNYAMQVLCAPSREELDAAHDQGKWLDIGIVSLHNLRHINKRRAVLWHILVFSSVPLHLLYNSAIFEVTVGQDYRIETTNAAEIEKLPAGWVNMTNNQWRKAYSVPYVAGYGDIRLAISDISFGVHTNSNDTWSATFPDQTGPGTDCGWNIWYPNGTLPSLPSHVEYAKGSFGADGYEPDRAVFNLYETQLPDLDQYQWPNFQEVLANEQIPITTRITICSDTGWLVQYPFKVQYALAEQTPYSSKVQIALPFIIIVITMNALKVIGIFLTIMWSSSDHILTVGDGISSFLERPEKNSIGKCLYRKADLTSHILDARELPWRSVRMRIASTLGGRRLGTIMTCVLSIGLNIVAVAGAIPNQSYQPGAPTHIAEDVGWGTASKKILPFTPATFDARSILTNSFIANAPQVILSLVYFSINRICTSICFEREWNNFGRYRKALRVTSPQGLQRPTHFLQLPYKWAVTLAFVSGFLHWLLSQSIFLSRLEVRDLDNTLYSNSVCACGYSPWSLLAFSLAFFTFLTVVLALLLRPIDIWIPVAAHCSAVISAACHPPPDDTDAHLKRVQWGVVKNRFGGTIQHCTFTSEEVTVPREGSLYA